MQLRNALRSRFGSTHLAGVISGLIFASSVLAADGDIIILREVQPRSATRPPLVADPNPQVVNPKPNAVLDQAMGELTDGDFAAVTGGHGLRQQGMPAPREVLIAERGFQPGSGAGALPASRAAGHSGSGLGAVAGQVNRSLQQGLRPLQGLNGR